MGTDQPTDGAMEQPTDQRTDEACLFVCFAQYPLSQDCHEGAGTCGFVGCHFFRPTLYSGSTGSGSEGGCAPVGEYQRPTSVLTPSPNVAEAMDWQRVPI
jgi:hypothetical protein